MSGDRQPAPLREPGDDELTVRFVTGEHFVANPVPNAEPIVVDARGFTVVAATGLGLTFGDGGAGKTTLWLDGAMHFAAGERWLGGLMVPVRQLRVGWVENEGPQEEFRRKLERKLAGWHGRIPADHFHMLDQPWGALNLQIVEHRAGLAAAIWQLELDLLILGPLNDLGMEGGGTPDEVRAFHNHLKEIQANAARPVALMVLHHENAAGRISGAWTGRPELLVHVTAVGNGKTRVFWQKSKWSGSLARTTSHLQWRDHEGFELADEPVSRPERTYDDIRAYVRANGGCSWSKVVENVHGTDSYLKLRRDQMLADGVLFDTGTGAKGTPMELWDLDDPARPEPLDETAATTRSGSAGGSDSVAHPGDGEAQVPPPAAAAYIAAGGGGGAPTPDARDDEDDVDW